MLVVVWSALNPIPEGVVWGLLGGASVDLFSASPFGTATLTFGVVAFASGLLGEHLRHINGALVLILPALATVAADVLMLLVLRSLGWSIDLPSTVALVILPAIVANTVVGPLAYIYARLGGSWLNARPRLG